MFSQFFTHFTTGRRVHLAIGATAALVALASAPAANAGTGPAVRAAVGPQGGEGFRISVMKASAGTASLALGVDDAGVVRLQQPVAGDASQRWSVAPDPAASTPAAPLASFITCIEQVRCAFTQPRPTTTHVFVNHGNGQCLTLAAQRGGVRAITTDCTQAASPAQTQRLHWNFSDEEVATTGVPQRYTALGGDTRSHLRCLTVPAEAQAAGTALTGAPCDNRLRWEQQLRFTAAA